MLSPVATDGLDALSTFPAGLSVDMLVVFAIILLALVFFVAQPIPIDTTAIAVMVGLIVLEPWTGVTPAEGVSGFSNTATITVLAMFILSEGVRQTGAIQLLTRKVSAYTGGSETKQLLAIMGLAGPPAGFVNNTPIVAILIPAISELAKKANTSPSKLLLPMSFAAMMGGTLTLIGTSTNLLASDIWARQGGGEPFSMFEFTQLGVLVLVVGIVYLMTVGRYLTPARIEPSSGPDEEFGLSEYLTDVVVREDADLVGSRLRDLRGDDLDLDVFQIVRNGRTITHGLRHERIRAGDILAVRADEETLQTILDEKSLDLLPEVIDEFDEEESAKIRRAVISELNADDNGSTPADERATSEVAEMEPGPGDAVDSVDDRAADAVDAAKSDAGGDAAGADTGGNESDDSDEETEDESDEEEEEAAEETLTEVVLLPGSWLTGRPFRVSDFQRRHDVTVLAIRRGSEVIRERMRGLRLQGGDTLLVQAGESTLESLRADRSLVVSGEDNWEGFDKRKIPVALGIIAGVVGLAALDILPIMVSSLAGIVAMIFSGCLRPADAYDAVSWDVIFLLAGVIPLGIAMEESGAAAFLGELIVASGSLLPPLALLGVFYLFTALLTNLVSNNASVVLMIPLAIDAASTLGANPFSFVLAVTFAASTAFMTPVGYQTNLMVYAPGGYRFSDFIRVGLPLQLLLTIVTPLGIAFFWGV